MRTRTFYAFAVFSSAILIIYALHFISVFDIYFQKHGFTRRFYNHQPVELKREDLGLSFDQVLARNGKVYLYQTESAFLTVRRCDNGAVLRSRSLALDRSCASFAPFIFFNADGEHLYFFSPSDSLILKYHPAADTVECFRTPFHFDRGMVRQGIYYFKRVNPFNRYSVIQRCDSSFNCRPVCTVDTLDNGGLPTDGMFEENGKGELLFAFYLRNEYLLLSDIRSGRYPLITTDTAQPDVVTHAGTYSFTGPVRAKTARISVSGGRLYVHSLTVSDNESRTSFRDHVIIDVYDLALHRYTGTLFIPNYVEGEPLSDFGIEEGKIYALHGRFLSVYQIPA